MIKRLLSTFLFALLLTVTACGQQPRMPIDGVIAIPSQAPSPQVTITAAQVFTGHLGDTWTFRNSYGDLTFVTIQAAPSNFMPAGTINLVFQKNACRAYWGAGICDTLIHFPLSLQPDGSWVSMGTLFYFPTQIPAYANGHTFLTSNFMPVPGLPTPYTIIPASATSGTVTSTPTEYDRWDEFDAYTFDSIVSGPAAARVRWETDSYIENVNTPVYSGPALVSEQFESRCIHEKWYFAPGFGLVKIIPLDNGSCTPADPNLAIVRIS